MPRLFSPRLYIVLFLHQTTTRSQSFCTWFGCISYYSYIKPQPVRGFDNSVSVVYRTIPTSNHNEFDSIGMERRLYIVLFLHQTTTSGFPEFTAFRLYIVLFLHQTTTYNVDIADKQHVTITFINKKWQSRKVTTQHP